MPRTCWYMAGAAPKITELILGHVLKLTRTCPTCLEPLPGSYHGSRKFCSAKCSDSKPKRPRPGLAAWGQWVARRRRIGLSIGERALICVGDLVRRDGSDCALCGKPVDFLIGWNDPESPTMDHIVPVSDPRSTHTLANLRLTHRGCNEKRGSSRDFFRLQGA